MRADRTPPVKHDVKEFFRFFLLLPAVFTRPSHERTARLIRPVQDRHRPTAPRRGVALRRRPLTNDQVEVARKLYEHRHPIPASTPATTTSGRDSSRAESSYAHAAVATGDWDRFPPPPSPLRFEQARATRLSVRRSQSSAEPVRAARRAPRSLPCHSTTRRSRRPCTSTSRTEANTGSTPTTHERTGEK